MEEAVAAVIVMVIGLVLLGIEAFFPGGYLLIPGAIMVIIGAYGYVAPGNFYTGWTPAVAIISAIPVTAATVYLYKRLGSPEPPATTVSGSLVGREGTVTVDITPGNMKGKVKIDSDTWSAEADSEIPAGTRVTVVSSEGVHVFVEKK